MNLNRKLLLLLRGLGIPGIAGMTGLSWGLILSLVLVSMLVFSGCDGGGHREQHFYEEVVIRPAEVSQNGSTRGESNQDSGMDSGPGTRESGAFGFVFDLDFPDGWEAASHPLSRIRIASFSIAHFSSLGCALFQLGGSDAVVEHSVQMWRRQVGLEPLDSVELSRFIADWLPLGDGRRIRAGIFDFFSSGEVDGPLGIACAVYLLKGRTVVLKMTGQPGELASAFEDFCIIADSIYAGLEAKAGGDSHVRP